MLTAKTALLILITVFVPLANYAQRAKNGSLTVANPNTIVNSYTSLTANATTGNTSITVANNALNTGTVNFNYTAPLAQGDLIMIIQMQGAELDINTYTVTGWGGNYTWADTFFIPGNPWVNPWVWGRVKNYNSSGKYEIVEVLSVSGSSTINLTCGLQHSYTVSGKTQVVRIPRFQDLVLANAASIVPTNWLGQTGGVVALEVNGNVTLNAGSKITASGKGFRGATTQFGGNVVSCVTHTNGAGKGNSQLGSTAATEGGKKGEGIGGYETEYASLFSTYGRGAAGNGGGGGGYQNSGGGGGSNVAIGTYTGKGIPSTAFANSVWNLESANLGGSVSSGGGRGGYSLSVTDQNELTVGPNNAAWCNGGSGGAGDARKENGGFGGHELSYDPTRVFLGGGGGAGDGNNTSQPGAGGNGGGIVFLTCYGTISGSGSLEADGAVGQNTNPLGQGVSTLPSTSNKKGNDGAGGAGGGGSIIVKNTNPITGTVALYARGGNGGNQVLTIGTGAAWEAAGPGGGGGGGFIAVANGTPTLSVAGGIAGTTNSTQVANFNVNGATGGSPGLNQTTSFFDLIPQNATICIGATATLSVTVVGVAPGTISWYTQQFGGTVVGSGTSFTTPALSTTTTYYVGTCPGTFRVPVTVTVTSGTTATFNQLGPFCSGQSFTLPTVSTNGITGSWSPTVNTTVTTNYTFTPNSGQCGLPTTMLVTITPAVTPVFTQITPVCIGTSFSLPAQSNEGISGTWSPAINTSATTTYTFTPTAGQCANTATMTVSITPTVTPTFTQLAPICSGGTIVLNTTSLNGISGTWSPAPNNTSTTTYTFTPTAGQCANTATMTVNVTPLTTPNFTQLAAICAGGSFTLNTTSLNGINGTWSPAINNSATTLYTFTPNTGQCASTATMTVVVNQPILPQFPSYGPFCLNDVLIQVMLPETSNNGVTGTWNPGMLSTAIAGSTQYTFTPNSGQCASTYTMNVLTNTLPVINLASSVISNENCGQSDGSIAGILLSGGSGSYQVVWNNNPQLNTVDLVNLSSGTYQLEVTDANGCVSQATLTVQGNPPPSIDATALQIVQPTCTENGSIQGLVTSGNQPMSYSWTNTSQTTLSLTNLSPGSYALTVVDAEGCISTFGPVILNTPTNPSASFTWTPQVPAENSLVVLTDNSSGAIVDYNWTINGQSFTGEQVNYTVLEGDYSIQLTVIDTNGCSDTYEVLLSVFDDLTVPNVMTINNDGVNDFFQINGLKPETSLVILNRWGEIVYASNDYQNDWDGKDKSGLQLTEGVYTYLIVESGGLEKHGFIHLVYE